MTTKPKIHLADVVAELVDGREHREHYTVKAGQTWFGQDHVTKVPSLLWQLEHASPSSQGAERGNAGFGSRPAARLESLDCLVTIDLEASRWVKDLGRDDDRDTAGLVRLLHGLHAGEDPCGHRKPGCCTAHEVERDIRRWWGMARIVTGWDTPAWRPANTCPVCGKRGGLRVRLEERTGMCVECREMWDESTIGLLAEHIRSENAEDQAAAPEAS